MGHTSYSSATYSTIKSSTAGRSTADIFTNNKTRTVDVGMNPKNLTVRECRDSVAHPLSLAVQFWLDVTGSMGSIPEKLIREKLGALIETMLKHKIADPAVLFGGIGDHYTDSAPLQVGQFESGAEELAKWLTGLFLEGGGGGQNKESYLLAWYVAARHTSIDCFEKRGKKGYLFTVGDEKTWGSLEAATLTEIFGKSVSESVSAEQLLREVKQMYHVYHIHVNSTGYANDPDVIGDWKRLLGENLIILDDSDVIAETIATTIAVMEGSLKSDVMSTFDPRIAASVSRALVNVNTNNSVTTTNVIEF